MAKSHQDGFAGLWPSSIPGPAVHACTTACTSTNKLSQSCVHAPLHQVLVTVSPTKNIAHAHPSLRSHPSGHGEFNITSLTSGQCCLSSSTSLARCPLCSNIASERVPAAGSCEAYSTTYCPCMHLRCVVFLVSAVLYPRTIRQAYSCATGRAISLTAYTVNSLHQILH